MINIAPEASSAPPAVRLRYTWRTLAAALVFLAGFLAARSGLAPPVSLAVGFAALLVWCREFIVLLRALDELQQRIQIAALAIGLGGVIMALTAAGMIALVVGTDGAHAAAAMGAALAIPSGSLAYLAALLIIRRRYA